MKKLVATKHFKERTLERQVFITEEVVRRFLEEKENGVYTLYFWKSQVYFTFEVTNTQLRGVTVVKILNGFKNMTKACEQNNSTLITIK